MAITSVASSAQGLGLGGGTTSGIDTTGSTLLTVAVSRYLNTGFTYTPTLSDSNSNTWTGLTEQGPATSNNIDEIFVRIYYCLNPTVGSGHTFTFPGGGLFSAPVLSIFGFSGVNTLSAFDQQNGANSSSTQGTSISTGSVTPGEDNELLVAALAFGSVPAGIAIDSSFTGLISSDYTSSGGISGAAAYKVQTSLGAENPQFSWTNSGIKAAAIATFKAAPAFPGDDEGCLLYLPQWSLGL